MITHPVVIHHQEGGSVYMGFECPWCRCGTIATITRNEFIRRFVGEFLIQEAMPTRSAEFREVFTSGVCPTCQEKLFGIAPE